MHGYRGALQGVRQLEVVLTQGQSLREGAAIKLERAWGGRGRLQGWVKQVRDERELLTHGFNVGPRQVGQ